jgi:hypothetical protein
VKNRAEKGRVKYRERDVKTDHCEKLNKKEHRQRESEKNHIVGMEEQIFRRCKYNFVEGSSLKFNRTILKAKIMLLQRFCIVGKES